MRIFIAVLLSLMTSSSALAAHPMISFSAAKKIWQESKDRSDYQAYADEFAQFNNYYHLDQKDDCYALGNGPMKLMLIITHKGTDKYAKIESVLSNVDTPKAKCFKKAYEDLSTKTPPFVPFVLEMNMAG